MIARRASRLPALYDKRSRHTQTFPLASQLDARIAHRTPASRGRSLPLAVRVHHTSLRERFTGFPGS
jgi:hypothetical protein